MDRRTLNKAFRNAWILLLVVVIAVLIIFGFTIKTIVNRKPAWEMGGKPFVPASSIYANDYYVPVDSAKREDLR